MQVRTWTEIRDARTLRNLKMRIAAPTQSPIAPASFPALYPYPAMCASFRLKMKKARAPALALLAMLFLAGCGGFETPEEKWYRRVLSGQLEPVPFSRDLRLLGYDGWRYLGKLPGAAGRAAALRISIWHEVYDGAVDPVLLVSHRPEEDEATGMLGGETGRDLRRVEADILLRRTLEDGFPVFSYRAVVNGIETARRLEVPQGSRFELTLRPTRRTPLRLGTDTLMAEALIEGWTQRLEGTTSYTMQRRTFRWYLRIDPVYADD